METINISKLNDGLPTISPIYGQEMAEAAAFCLQRNSHESEKCILSCIKTLKDDTVDFHLAWDELDPRVETTYGDLDEATEHGAMGLAMLLALKLTKYTTVKRSMKGRGFDYWLCDKDDYNMFQEKARLEISGIFKGDDPQFKTRINRKFKQTNISDGYGFDCFVSVIEFGKPKASFLSKEDNYERN
jgi:hypothetical protein